MPIPTRPRLRTRLLAAAGVLALTLTACSGGAGNKATTEPKTSSTSSTSSTATQRGDKYMLVNAGPQGPFVQTFNPFSPSANPYIKGSVYETLFFYNPHGKPGEKPSPQLGTEFSWSADFKTLKITTREGVKWSDGKPFTAKDVAFTINLYDHNKSFNAGEPTLDAKADDDTHVTVTFKEPSLTNGPQLLGLTFIVPEHIWKDVPDPAKFENKTPVGTGAFTVEQFTTQAISYKANPNYWEPGLPKIAGFRAVAVSDNQGMISKFLGGELDVASAFVPKIETVLKGKNDLRWMNTGQAQNVLATCSSTELGCKGAQTDPAVRQALYYAIDRDQLNKLSFAGYSKEVSPTFALLGRDDAVIDPKFKDDVVWKANQAKADQILTGAGYAKGPDGYYAKDGKRLSMTLKTVTGWTDYISAVDVISEQLKSFGIEIKPQQSVYNDWASQVGNGTFELALYSLGQGPAPDVWYIYNANFSTKQTAKVGTSVPASANAVRYSNKVVDTNIAKAGGTEDQAVRQQAFNAIQEQIVKDMPYIPLMTNSAISMYSEKSFTGFPTNDNLYADASPFNTPSNGIIMKTVTQK